MQRLRFGWSINKIVFLVALLVPLALNAQWTNTGGSGGSASFADSARAASIADSAKAAPAANQGAHIVGDYVTTYTAGNDTIGFYANPVVRPHGEVMRRFYKNASGAKTSGSGVGLKPGYSDFAVSWMGRDSLGGQDSYIIFNDNASDGGFTILIQSGGSAPSHMKIRFVSDNGSAQFYDLGLTDTSNVWHSHFVCVDRGGYAKHYVDGALAGQASVSSWADSNLSSSAPFSIGITGTASYAAFKADNVRVFNFGTNPTVDWDELARRLAERPLAPLSELGFGEWENAHWANLLSNADFESGSISPWLKAPSSIATNGVTSNASRVRTGSYSGWVTVSTNNSYMYLTQDVSMSGVAPGQKFVLELGGWVYIPSGASASTSDIRFIDIQPGVNYTYGNSCCYQTTTKGDWVRLTRQYIITIDSNFSGTKLGTVAFKLGDPVVGDTLFVDDTWARTVGEVAFWKFNDASNSTVFHDLTDNNNDLTPYSGGAVTTAGTLQEEAPFNHLWADRVHGDTLSAEYIYLGQSMVPYDSADATGGVDLGSQSLHFDDVWAQTYNTATADIAEYWLTAGGTSRMTVLVPKGERYILNQPIWKLKDAVVTRQPTLNLADSSSWRPLKALARAETKRGKTVLRFRRGIRDTLYVWYARPELSPGDVVILDTTSRGKFKVKLCDQDGWSGWWSVVSENPALAMGQNLAEGGVPVAYIGRVRAKVKGPVKRGDRLIPDGKGRLRRALSGEKSLKYAIALGSNSTVTVRKMWVLLQ